MKSGKQRRKEIMARRHERAVLHSTEDVYAPPSTLPVGAVWANHAELAHNDNTYSLMPWFYIDRPFTCRDCGSFQIWTAKQQKWWYEIAKGHIHTTAVRCRPCRRIEEARKTQARRVHLEGLGRKRASTRLPERGDATTVALVASEDSMPTKRTRIAAKNQALDPAAVEPLKLFVRTFVVPQKVDRFIHLLTTAKGRGKMSSYLAHFLPYLRTEFAAPVPVDVFAGPNPQKIRAFLRNAGVTGRCLVCSGEVGPAYVPLSDPVFDHLGWGFYGIISASPSSSGFYFGEYNSDSVVLRVPNTAPK